MKWGSVGCGAEGGGGVGRMEKLWLSTKDGRDVSQGVFDGPLELCEFQFKFCGQAEHDTYL